MKCSVCPKTIPAARLREKPNVKTCSEACSGIRQGNKANNRWKSYYQRLRKNLGEIKHVPLVDGTELKVRKGHVVGVKQPEGGRWQLAVVVRATKEGRAIHACPASEWDPGMKVTSDTRLAGAQIAVLPPEWAEYQTLASELEERRFPYLEELQEALEERREALTQG